MASVESDEKIAKLLRSHAKARYFRVREPGAPLARGEMQCPASVEVGHRLTCSECGVCAGRSKPGRSVSITAHGAAALRTWLPIS